MTTLNFSNPNAFFSGCVTHYALPPQVELLLYVDSGTRLLTSNDVFENYRHLFAWVNFNLVQQHLAYVSATGKPGDKYVMAISDKGEVKEYTGISPHYFYYNSPFTA